MARRMKQAVFLRAVNVGGHNMVSVAAVAKKLGYQNFGAAGTFVAPKGSAAEIREAIVRELGFETDVMVVDGPKLLALVAKAPLAKVEGRAFVAVLGEGPASRASGGAPEDKSRRRRDGMLAKAPGKKPKLPVEDGKGARLVAVDGPFALGVVLPGAKPGTSIGALVERALGVPATVRGWATMERVAEALSKD